MDTFVTCRGGLRLHSQSESGHVYQAIEWRALPGQEDAHSQSYHDFLRPIWSEVVRRGGMVRYTDHTKRDGDTPGTHLLLMEFESQESLDDFGQVVDEASRSVTGQSWAEISEEEFLPRRGPDQVRGEIYVSPPGM